MSLRTAGGDVLSSTHAQRTKKKITRLWDQGLQELRPRHCHSSRQFCRAPDVSLQLSGLQVQKLRVRQEVSRFRSSLARFRRCLSSHHVAKTVFVSLP